jgi:hypothetical protein
VRTKDGIAMDPDDQARHAVQVIFQRFDELGSVNAVLRLVQREGLLIGIRPAQGSTSGPLEWRVPNRSTITRMLHHPIYAGAYIYGRALTDPSRRVEGKSKSGRRLAAQEEWQVLLPDRLPAYISWEQWERNQRRMKENSTSFSAGPPRGASLIAGRITCGRCGSRMPISYKPAKGACKTPYFGCTLARMNLGEPLCQSFNGRVVESLIEKLVLTALAPASVELSLRAAESLDSERERREIQHTQAVQRATYESELARRRYDEVDPGNRLVAAELERRWEASLQVQRKTEEALNRFRQDTPTHLTTAQRQAVIELANDFPKLWHSESTSAIDRQTIVRALITDIVVTVVGNTERLSVTVHWAGGLQTQHESRRHVQEFSQLEASQELANRAGQLYNEGYPLAEIAKQLNSEGYHPAKQERFTETSIGAFCNMLRRKGIITTAPKIARHFWRAGVLCQKLGIAKPTLSGWRRRDWIQYRQLGKRYIYWADADELKRLKRLARHPASGSTPTPTNLTIPISKMPVAPCDKS